MGQVPLDVTKIILSVSLRYFKKANKNISMDNFQNINSLPAGDKTIPIVKSLDVHVGKAKQKDGPVLDPKCLTL